VFETGVGQAVFGVAEPSLRLPSTRDQRAFGEDFLGMAYRLLGQCVNHAGLRPDDRVLDVGCGAGRLAYALTSYLSLSGSYDGFDARSDFIDSARGAIIERFPHFSFRAVPVRNALYNAEGAEDAAEFEFPYPAESFDLVCAISVFQHNRPPAIRRYLREIFRVLRPDGRCLITCFLLNPDRLEVDKRASSLNFVHPLNGSWAADRDLPEIGIAHEQSAVHEWVRGSGLACVRLLAGMWRGGAEIFSYQDLLILRKP
jgi:SAM-dependent methyltransferase